LHIPTHIYKNTSITRLDGSLAISYGGWVCRYSTDGVIRDLGRLTANRNGHYKAYFAEGERQLKIKILIEKEEK